MRVWQYMNAQTQVSGTTFCADTKAKTAASAFAVLPLPYAENALEPVISAKTLRLHYDKHYKGYVDTLNQLIAGTPFADMSLKQLVLSTARERQHTPDPKRVVAAVPSSSLSASGK